MVSSRKYYKSNSVFKVGVNGAEDTPVPIPNTEVKLCREDDTWLVTAWESISMPAPVLLGQAFLLFLEVGILKSVAVYKSVILVLLIFFVYTLVNSFCVILSADDFHFLCNCY